MNTRLPTVITLPWRADAAEFWFARLSHRPYAMLLHSGHADHPYSRFDILVADPLETLVTRGNLTTVGGLESSDDPLTLLQQRLDALGLSASPHPDLPFQGGALGAVAHKQQHPAGNGGQRADEFGNVLLLGQPP